VSGPAAEKIGLIEAILKGSSMAEEQKQGQPRRPAAQRRRSSPGRGHGGPVAAMVAHAAKAAQRRPGGPRPAPGKRQYFRKKKVCSFVSIRWISLTTSAPTSCRKFVQEPEDPARRMTGVCARHHAGWAKPSGGAQHRAAAVRGSAAGTQAPRPVVPGAAGAHAPKRTAGCGSTTGTCAAGAPPLPAAERRSLK